MIGWTKPITAAALSSGTLSFGSKNDTLNDPLSFMGDKEGQVDQPGGERDKKAFHYQYLFF